MRLFGVATICLIDSDIDLMNADPDADPLESIEYITSQGEAMKKWTPLMEAEWEALKAELEDLE